MADKVTFGAVHYLPGEFGFEQTPVKGSHVLFEHKPSGTLVMFRPHRLSERIDPMTLAVVRSVLAENGFLERDDFADALREAAANGKAKAKGD